MSLYLVFLPSPRHRPLCVGAGAGPSLALLAQAVCSEAGFQTFSDYSLVPVGEVFLLLPSFIFRVILGWGNVASCDRGG